MRRLFRHLLLADFSISRKKTLKIRNEHLMKNAFSRRHLIYVVLILKY